VKIDVFMWKPWLCSFGCYQYHGERTMYRSIYDETLRFRLPSKPHYLEAWGDQAQRNRSKRTSYIYPGMDKILV